MFGQGVTSSKMAKVESKPPFAPKLFHWFWMLKICPPKLWTFFFLPICKTYSSWDWILEETNQNLSFEQESINFCCLKSPSCKCPNFMFQQGRWVEVSQKKPTPSLESGSKFSIFSGVWRAMPKRVGHLFMCRYLGDDVVDVLIPNLGPYLPKSAGKWAQKPVIRSGRKVKKHQSSIYFRPIYMGYHSIYN